MPDTPQREAALLATDLHIEATYRLTEALVASENRMRRRIELLSEIVFETDPGGTLVFLNKAWEKALGHSLEQCLGRSLSAFVLAEDQPLCEQVIKGTAPLPAAGRPRIRLVRADGGIAWMEISAAQLADGGVVGTLHDVTTEKRAQDELAKLSLVASFTDNLVIITDREGRTEWVNQAFTRRTGYALEDMLGRKPGEILQGPGTDPQTVAEIRAHLAEGRSFKAELLNYTRAGEPYWVSFQISPIRDAAGRVERFVSIQADSTELRRTQRELETAKERAEQMARQAQAANQAKSEFLATMSHEIRTPMNGILGMTELLLQTPLESHQRELTETVAHSGQELLRIINDILDFSKIEGGHLKLAEEQFDLRPLVEGVVSVVAHSGHSKPVTVQAVCDAAVPVRLCGDAGRLRQVLLNLVGNGLKFTTAGSVVTRIRSLENEGHRSRLRFEVTDTGIGIGPDKIALLFQPFQQVDSSPARRHGGTGLGLAISRRLVELMNGRIGVQSREGQGSTFWFELEFSRPAEADVSALHVLVAEDHPITQRLALLSLGKLGCKAAAVTSGRELFAKLAESPWDVVILSRQLPDMTLERVVQGLEALASPPALVGLVTGDSSGDTSAFHAVGIKVCLAKPFTLWQLGEAITEANSTGKATRPRV